MAGLEAANYLTQLVASNPDGNDPKSQGDDHLRLIKQVLQNSFPNISGAVTVTQAQLNAIVDAVYVNNAITVAIASAAATAGLSSVIAAPSKVPMSDTHGRIDQRWLGQVSQFATLSFLGA